MTTEPKLEAYLFELDKYLGQIPVSDRADIIIKIKSHILDAQANNPTQNINIILDSMGDPETVAKRYLQERGLKISLPAKTSSMMWLASSIKWLTIGFLGFMGIIVLVVSLLVWRFTPLIAVDEANNRVSFAGGIIQVSKNRIDHSTDSFVKTFMHKTDNKAGALPAKQPNIPPNN